SVTFAVCACAANGAPRTLATATATSFFFIESLLYRINLAEKRLFAPAIGTFSNAFGEVATHCAKRPKALARQRCASLRIGCRLWFRNNMASADIRRPRAAASAKMMIGKGKLHRAAGI